MTIGTYTSPLIDCETGTYDWSCKFESNDTGAPDGLTPPDSDITLARTAAGTYTVTFGSSVRPQGMLWGHAEVLEDDTSLWARVTGYVPSTGVLTIKTYAPSGAGTAADWTGALTVASDTVTLGSAGYIAAVFDATNGVATPLLQTGTPASGQCTVTYSAGVATLTFAAADSVAAARAILIPAESTNAMADSDSDDKTIQVRCKFTRNGAGKP